mmetsp:Transcript_15512/g.26277  ORF Transcript_15512/g.26277 Transcript_15512/m.26277 type:complete len:171 (-) Transcript_15512:786-1298(-)
MRTAECTLVNGMKVAGTARAERLFQTETLTMVSIDTINVTARAPIVGTMDVFTLVDSMLTSVRDLERTHGPTVHAMRENSGMDSMKEGGRTSSLMVLFILENGDRVSIMAMELVLGAMAEFILESGIWDKLTARAAKPTRMEPCATMDSGPTMPLCGGRDICVTAVENDV